jgi:hypothetical protein
MLLLCLIAALAGTPLRQAEAAGDLARSLAEMGGGVVEEVDGGVGDDAGEAILRAGGGPDSSQVMGEPAGDHGASTPIGSTGFRSPVGDGRCPAVQPESRAPASSVRRHAWLQHFLF